MNCYQCNDKSEHLIPINWVVKKTLTEEMPQEIYVHHEPDCVKTFFITSIGKLVGSSHTKDCEFNKGRLI